MEEIAKSHLTQYNIKYKKSTVASGRPGHAVLVRKNRWWLQLSPEPTAEFTALPMRKGRE